MVHVGLDVSGKGHLGVFWAKGDQQLGTLFERWNTYSRIRVTGKGESTPTGWGFIRMPEMKIEQKRLDIDADAATVITRHDGDLSKLSYLKDDVINAAYLVQPTADVAVVGVGGGRDILPGFTSAPSASAELRSIPRSSKSSPINLPTSPAISIVTPASRWSMPKPAATSTIRPTGMTSSRYR